MIGDLVKESEVLNGLSIASDIVQIAIVFGLIVLALYCLTALFIREQKSTPRKKPNERS